MSCMFFFFLLVTSPQYIGTVFLGIQYDYTWCMYMSPTLHAVARRCDMTASRNDQNINTGTHTDAGGLWVICNEQPLGCGQFHQRQSTRITDVWAYIMPPSSSPRSMLQKILPLWPIPPLASFLFQISLCCFTLLLDSLCETEVTPKSSTDLAGPLD